MIGVKSKFIIFQVTRHYYYTSCLIRGPAILGQYLDLQNSASEEPEIRRKHFVFSQVLQNRT